MSEILKAVAFVFFCYYQHYYLRDLPGAAYPDGAWALYAVVLRWEHSRVVARRTVGYSSCVGNVGVIACREKF